MTDKQLGVGVRVYIAWVPDNRQEKEVEGRCKTGTITEGPFLPGQIVRDGNGELCKLINVRWNLILDSGGEVSAIEHLLTPIDDDSSQSEVNKSEVVTHE